MSSSWTSASTFASVNPFAVLDLDNGASSSSSDSGASSPPHSDSSNRIQLLDSINGAPSTDTQANPSHTQNEDYDEDRDISKRIQEALEKMDIEGKGGAAGIALESQASAEPEVQAWSSRLS